LVQLQPGDTVLDIGSNDSTLLQHYSKDLTRIGMDPTGKQFKEYYGDVELVPTYFTQDNFTKVYGSRKCKVVSSISMFYDLPDPVQFAKDIHSILEEDGVWTCEQSYLMSMLKTNSIDTICHEHLEYYALYQIKEIADRADLHILDVKFNDCNGGSFRVYFAKKTSTRYPENVERVREILQAEIEYGILEDTMFTTFMTNCGREIQRLRDFVDTLQANGKTLYIYGASTKGNCLLQYANITEKDAKYAVERNPKKIGKMTNTGSEIIGEEKMREHPPDFLLVLPWHFKEEILVREKEFLEGGGQFVFPFPHFEVVGSKPKALITGCDGMIAHYVKQRFSDYHLYGIGPSKESNEDSGCLRFTLDLKDTAKLEHVVSIVRPQVIVHLASISSSTYALYHPIETLYTNGMVAAHLCEMIHRNQWTIKLWNASSIEMYKGHVDYTVQEDDHHLYHSHPYSIAKTMSHSMVEFYRNTYGLPFSNGILSTIESPLKKPIFLLNKVSAHIKEWKKGNKTPLKVGNLDSYRNILHASDVAEAIHLILEQPKGDTYLICHQESHPMIDLVRRMYGNQGMELEPVYSCLVEKNTGETVVIVDEKPICDTTPTHIRSEAHKLTQLGWTPRWTVDQILEDLVSIV
jgi:GDP-mannose 4,6-dehydratase